MPNDPYEDDDSAQNDIEGKYANYFEVGHNAFEFLLDFGQKYSGVAQERIHTRIIMGPRYAKELLKVLEQSIEQHEDMFGSIELDDDGRGNSR